MSQRRRVLLLIAIMSIVTLVVGGIAVVILYRIHFKEEKARLVETAQSQARLIEAIARYDAVYSQDYPGGSEEATLSQIRDAHGNYAGFGKTGEFTLARREGDLMVFLLSHRHFDLNQPRPVPFDSELAIPMRLSLSGKSGTVVGIDYRGETVLAAYEPVGELDLGIVAKIDWAEHRAPFVRAGVIAGLSAILVISLGAFLFMRVTSPMIKRLEESELRFRSTFEQAAVGIAHASPEGSFLLINQRFCNIVGYTRAEMFGRTFQEITHPDDLNADLDYIRQLLAGKISTYSIEKRYIRKDGSDVWVGLTKSLVRGSSGEPKYMIGVVEDISKRKQAEEKLKEYSEHLEEKVEERTKELKDAQEELVRKEKLATLGQLAGGVGHELRNPLGVISNSVYFLNMKLKDADEKTLKHLNILKREVERANTIITSLLDFSRSKLPSREEGDANDIVKNALASIEIPGNISVETRLDETLPRILLDPDQIQQIFQNIISNSVQAMGEGGRLKIETGVKGKFAEIIFKDIGEGIAKENLSKIFEPLFTTRAKGIGLGLAIVKSFVDEHKGQIEVKSEVGEGTTIIVKLPLDGKKGG